MKDPDAMRTLVVDAVLANPAVSITDAALLEKLRSGQDCTFEELEFDSLARIELCIWLEVEAGFQVVENDVLELHSIFGLADHLAGAPR